VTDRITFLPLTAGPVHWAKTALSSTVADRLQAAGMVRSACYDIAANAKVLEDFYRTCLADIAQSSDRPDSLGG